ncbi:phage virion morphogenesis protein [Diaphorobacter caeni]|uniref:phage virion morphogenesis protein n=1 Tax=Diaphorobacter caeni TaxID=2784387 RepID=UPI00188FDF6A|nr:phage virion morphogenesis protein [Diaphorobacter caeni]MBF5003363.1 phage virion morphogenesis protein [Diaphorobacter caeni]
MADFKALETWAEGMLQKLQPSQRRRITVDVARKLRAANAARMAAQTEPDGNRWEPRKTPATTMRSKAGRIRQAAKQKLPLFAKMKAAKNLKARGSPGSALVEIVSRAQRIARVHHFGETDNVNPHGPAYRYPARELVGISDADTDLIRDVLLRHLSS